MVLQRTFRISASDYGQVVLLTGRLERLATQAPGGSTSMIENAPGAATFKNPVSLRE